ncbi:DUF4249 domain-containing protein [Mucilaginibacter sp. McL0603]|uniref:DUF4249 domain-containing protein n=1 Tax=Mucilaginibacter sp. McL0603 TaxID=3415670 RepID=UPI003CFB3460
MLRCKKPYLPPVVASGASHLVVEGMINTGADTTIIRLTHTIALSTPGSAAPAETGASVVVQSDANTSYPLTETSAGYYIEVGLNLNPSGKYRLQITTADNKVYQSDYVAAKISPAIDSLSFQAKSDGMEVNAATHDPTNNTRYYRWDYTETWIIHAAFDSQLMLKTDPVDTIVFRGATAQIYKCWQSDKSSDIILNSTAKLTNDIVTSQPVGFIPSNSEKFTERYSILVKQYALTPDAHDYYQQLRKNTEQLGGIFDPQPSSLTGNIHCTTIPAEQVIGYITAGTVTQKRIFISTSALPVGAQWRPLTPYSGCLLASYLYSNPKTGNNDVASYLYAPGTINIPVEPIQQPGHPPTGYTASSGVCVDCTLRGTSKAPDFWTSQ